ncbi:MAG: aspartate/glutamate racemase family protein [Chitinophagaceae bacterium]
MKTIGLIGGLSWHSTIDYYRVLNETVGALEGGVSSAKILMYSVNFAEIKALTFNDDWDGISRIICDIAKKLEAAGADCLLLGANTMHKIADEVQAAIGIPLIHIAKVTAAAITQKQLRKVALLGTKYTMELGFYQEKLSAAGIETIIPADEDRVFINNAIYEEMGAGIFLPATRDRFHEIIEIMLSGGAEGIILGCTEIPILLKDTVAAVPFFDTGYIHSIAAVDYALS